MRGDTLRAFLSVPLFLSLLMQVWTPSPTGPTKAAGGGGGVAFDNHCNSGNVQTTGTLDCSAAFTIASGATNAVAFIYTGHTTDAVTSVKLDPTSGTAFSFLCKLENIASNETITVYMLANPSSGSHTPEVVTSAPFQIMMHVHTFTGGTGTFGTCASHTGSASTITQSVTSATGYLVDDVVLEDEGTCPTPSVSGTGQVIKDSTCTNSDFGAWSSVMTGASTSSPSWASFNGNGKGELGVSIQ